MAICIVYVVLSFCAVFGAIVADSEYGEGAHSYSTEAFNNNVIKFKNKHFVMFYAPWCGQCKKLAPTWDELAKIYNATSPERPVVIAKVDCTEETAVCADQGVTGYPTLKFYYQSAIHFSSYEGARDLDALKTFVEEQFRQAEVLDLTVDDFDEILAHGMVFVRFSAPWSGHCKWLAPVWEELSKKFVGAEDVHIAKVDCTVQEDLCKKHEIRGYPTLILFNNGVKITDYNGDRYLDSLYSFVEQNKVVVKKDEL
ncbi:thioredoxin domain-containing protein 5-like [Haliotis cracherodii]|uniref:thioredoxin domain-containing protein 5-like n=1 Tax=Haliotis cracherodii TaxID=6455 RepID=UPI0039EB4812